MASELQQLVENLGRRFDRSVAIDDRNVRLLAYTSHRAEVDDARIASVMQRGVSADLIEHVHRSGALTADGMFIVPASPKLGMNIERIGFPIRYRGDLLGFLWLLSSEGEVTNEQENAAKESADSAAQILQREHLLGQLSRGRTRELMRDLLSDETNVRVDAAEKLIDEELVVTGHVVVIVARPEGTPLSEGDRLALASCLERTRRSLPPRSAIQLERPDHAILLVVVSELRGEIEAVAQKLQRDISAELDRPSEHCPVGVGQESATLSDARRSYLEAKRAAKVAGIVRVLGPTVRYASLGVYGLLAELPTDRLRESLHPGLKRLLQAEDDGESLVRTLDVFLENAGNVQATATEMCVHRATVYYRLKRIEQLAEVDLSKGDDRLSLHFSLKVARLIGLR
ncbi:PucR family transcriptional regulator [Microbacterium oxydans]|uniref:PucR family transcriptional regulator n=1 Tax=Microbacterium oxydans TaxID=82380 RepID=UPI0019D00E4A|nr:helix-turn-helix domain-containing protein [Microbacterium oxydans]